MKITEYSADIKELYHFESSQHYCDKNKIIKAYNKAVKEQELNRVDIAQLNTIFELEILRYEYAKKKVTLSKFKAEIDRLNISFFELSGFHVFDETDLHNKFYDFLNGEYNVN